jgi:hypothetical protein
MPKANPIIAFAAAFREHIQDQFEDASVRVEKGQIKVVLTAMDASFTMFIGPKGDEWAITMVDLYSRPELLTMMKECLESPNSAISVRRTDRVNLSLYVAPLTADQAAGVANAFIYAVTSMPALTGRFEPRAVCTHG